MHFQVMHRHCHAMMSGLLNFGSGEEGAGEGPCLLVYLLDIIFLPGFRLVWNVNVFVR